MKVVLDFKRCSTIHINIYNYDAVFVFGVDVDFLGFDVLGITNCFDICLKKGFFK